MAAYYPTNVTTDHIQQYLDENKSLILKIVESQNSGKLSECAENQARLQRNLMFLAAIADSQPQPQFMRSQFASSGLMQPGAQYLHQQQPQAQHMSPQSLMTARTSMLYSQQPYGSLQHQIGITSGGGAGVHHMMQDESVLGIGGSLDGGSLSDRTPIGRKLDVGNAESGDGRE